MKTLPQVEMPEDYELPRFASCLQHGRYGAAHDAREESPWRTTCSACQSLTRYGSNSLDAPLRGTRDWGSGTSGKREIVATLIAALVLLGFYCLLERSNARLDRAVSRIERASR